MKRVFFLLVMMMFTLSTQLVQAQKWGKTTEEERQMLSFPDDSEADAVVLFDRGEIVITPGFELEMKMHKRIKILTEAGKERADIVINYWHKDKVNGLKAHTILPNGKKVKVKGKMIQERRNGNRKEKVFTFPSVEVGAILEYKYEFWSKYIHYLEPWYFQNEDFTIKSECSLVLPLGFVYNCYFNNPLNLVFEPERERMLSLKSTYGSVPHRLTWAQENLPGVKNEPYMKNQKDFMTTIYFQMMSFKNAYVNYQFAKSWNMLAENISKAYKPYAGQNRGLKEAALDLTKDCENEHDKVKAVYHHITTQIKTAPSRGFWGDHLKKPKQVLEEKDGTAAEKNLLLINLLSHLGIDANPVIISTRNNGRVQADWVQLQQFNHVIVLYEMGRQKLFMDTGNKYCPLGKLPPNDINELGLLIVDGQGTLIDIPVPDNMSMQRVESTGKINEEGQLSCQSVFRFEGYQAVAQRSRLAKKGKEDYIDDLIQNKLSDAEVDSFKVIYEEDMDVPLIVDVSFKSDAFADVAGEMIYLNPCLFHRIEKNPFVGEERSYPIDYAYMQAFTEKTILEIPEDYCIVENIERHGSRVANLAYQTMTASDSTCVNYERSFQVSQVVYPPGHYQTLKKKYGEMVNFDARQVVLKRGK